MKLVCLSCKKEYDLQDEDLNNIANIIKRNNLSVTAFLDAASPLGGECTDGDVHMFEFDKIFDENIHELAKKHAQFLEEQTKSKTEYANIQKQIHEFTIQLKPLIVKSNEILDKIRAQDNELNMIKEDCFVMTRIDDITLWEVKKEDKK